MDTIKYSVPGTPDNDVEADEDVVVTLSGPTNGAALDGGATSATGDIADNDTFTELAFGVAPAIDEGGDLVFTVTRTGGTEAAHQVSYAIQSGGATAGEDYTSHSGTLNFAINSPSETVIRQA